MNALGIRIKVFVGMMLRKQFLQPLWEHLNRLSKVGMNYRNYSYLRNGEFWYLRQLGLVASDKPLVIFDVGANGGQYINLIGKAVQDKSILIHAFEPSATTFQLLLNSLHNLPHNLTVKTHSLGLSSRNGYAVLHGDKATSPLRSLYNPAYPEFSFDSEVDEDIRLATLDEMVSDFSIESIDLLKIDVEGHEYDVLMGAKESIAMDKIKRIQFEMTTSNLDSKRFFIDFYDFLSDKYNLYRLLPSGKRMIRRYSSDLEVVDYINYVAEHKELA